MYKKWRTRIFTHFPENLMFDNGLEGEKPKNSCEIFTYYFFLPYKFIYVGEFPSFLKTGIMKNFATILKLIIENERLMGVVDFMINFKCEKYIRQSYHYYRTGSPTIMPGKKSRNTRLFPGAGSGYFSSIIWGKLMFCLGYLEFISMPLPYTIVWT